MDGAAAAGDRYRAPGSFGGFGGTGGTGGFKGFGPCGEVGGFSGTGGFAGTVVMGRWFFVMWSTSRYSKDCRPTSGARPGRGRTGRQPNPLGHGGAAGEQRRKRTLVHDEDGLVRPKVRGVSEEEVAAVLGHTSTRITRLHHDCTQVPPMVKVPIKLFPPRRPSGADKIRGLKLVAS
ncbi:MAG: hypothetical protein ACT4TC_04650 [Myxococcaceae bacterium]